jgi:hypothetical protein
MGDYHHQSIHSSIIPNNHETFQVVQKLSRSENKEEGHPVQQTLQTQMSTQDSSMNILPDYPEVNA